MTIGRFARMSGLSVHTLRLYDDFGILTPTEIDPERLRVLDGVREVGGLRTI